MSNSVYTIGYTAFEINDFISKLKELRISCLIDVRSNPVASEYYEKYSRIHLEPLLISNNIYYRNYAVEFGARQENYLFYQKYGYLDFELFRESKEFKSGIAKIQKGLDLGYSFVLMCAEKDPCSCHRSILVAKGLKDAGIPVKHIITDGSLLTQEDIEDKLLDMYFPNRAQLDLFNVKTEEEYLKEAYQLQNSKIGYKKDRVA